MLPYLPCAKSPEISKRTVDDESFAIRMTYHNTLILF
jgi:hypothetical protein